MKGEQMMITEMNPYLITDGNGQEAVAFYKNALDATVADIKTFEEIPGEPASPIPDDLKNRVMHARLKVGNSCLMISDTFPGPHQEQYQIGSQVEIALIVDNAEKAKEVFRKLADGGKEVMPLQETFWSPCYGQVTDKFGVSWQISTETKTDS